MWSLFKAALLLGAVAAFLFLLPFGGRTLADRWRAADGAADFASRTWSEMRGAPASSPATAGKPARKPGARPQARTGAAAPAPEEGVTEAERQSLEKLLGDHLADPKR
jgi:hypothetical protein